jgi:hypothetical protein
MVMLSGRLGAQMVIRDNFGSVKYEPIIAVWKGN